MFPVRWLPGDAYETFLTAWDDEIGGTPAPAVTHAHAYDATNILLEAVAAAGRRIG